MYTLSSRCGSDSESDIDRCGLELQTNWVPSAGTRQFSAGKSKLLSGPFVAGDITRHRQTDRQADRRRSV